MIAANVHVSCLCLHLGGDAVCVNCVCRGYLWVCVHVRQYVVAVMDPSSYVYASVSRRPIIIAMSFS